MRRVYGSELSDMKNRLERFQPDDRGMYRVKTDGDGWVTCSGCGRKNGACEGELMWPGWRQIYLHSLLDPPLTFCERCGLNDVIVA